MQRLSDTEGTDVGAEEETTEKVATTAVCLQILKYLLDSPKTCTDLDVCLAMLTAKTLKF